MPRPNTYFRHVNFHNEATHEEFRELAAERGISFQELMWDHVLTPSLTRLHNDFAHMTTKERQRELTRLRIEREDTASTLDEIDAEIDNCLGWLAEEETP